MRISLSGRISIEVDEIVVDEQRLGGARARLAFAVLVLERFRPVDRHHLAEVLWPGALPASWEAALRVVVSRVRSFLAAAGLPAAKILINSHGFYELTLPDDVLVDVEEAAASVELAELVLAAGGHERAVAAAGRARDITARVFITGAEGEWVDAVRRRLAGLRVRALDAIARGALHLGDTALAIDAAQELLGLDPFRDGSHVLVMEAQRAAGNRAEALRAYGWCRHLLAEELGVEPSPETESLYQSILREEIGREGRDAPWSAADGPPHNLPTMLTSLVGREREVREILKLLEGDRLVTLVGPPGAGKTRLAMEVAGRARVARADGVWFVDLGPQADETAVAGAFAAALGVVEQPPRSLVDALVEHLRPRATILVVDNCEHVLEVGAALVDTLLRACPLLCVLATSREPLGVPGELLRRVPSLSIPEATAGSVEPSGPGPEPGSIESVLEYDAPRLFVDRCRALVADQSFTDADAPALTEICVRLDGTPLAIELAAACITVLSVGEIAARLDDPFRLLTLGSRTAPPRHRTLFQAVDWSYQLLTPGQRVLLRRLPLLADGFTLEAAEEVASRAGAGSGSGDVVDRAEVLDLLAGLVASSLVVSNTAGPRARYRLLEVIRHFARDRLVEAGEAAAPPAG